TIAGFIIQLVLVWAGKQWPIVWTSADGWKWSLLGYAFLASVLPVWSLLQPRDFLNSLLLYLGLLLCFVGFFVWSPEFAAPAFDASPEGAPPFYPFVFITIACGAASGFHALVSSGTTAKQLDRESHARPVGFGGMIGESLLGLLAVLATTAGVRATTASDAKLQWASHYHDWHHAQGLSAKMDWFIQGAAQFIAELGVEPGLAAAFIAVVVVSFALTTLDSATRLLRYNVEEIGNSLGVPLLQNRWTASLLAVAAIAFFAFYRIGGRPAGVALWQIFGTVNQLLAGLTLLVVTLYLRARGKNPWFTGIPMAFMLGTTVVAMFANLRDFSNGFTFRTSVASAPLAWELLIVALVLAVLAIWLLIEAAIRWREPVSKTLSWEVFVDDDQPSKP
ncbi:MAG: carbon starvation protein A, partial [Planctomycetes bacterium]|nr:carbon starvation protein A [Planctomycetota bacterium]